MDCATLKFSTSRMSVYTIFPEFYEISVHFFPPIFQFSTSLEQAFFCRNYNAFATCYSEECQNARAVFNPAGCIWYSFYYPNDVLPCYRATKSKNHFKSSIMDLIGQYSNQIQGEIPPMSIILAARFSVRGSWMAGWMPSPRNLCNV